MARDLMREMSDYFQAIIPSCWRGAIQPLENYAGFIVGCYRVISCRELASMQSPDMLKIFDSIKTPKPPRHHRGMRQAVKTKISVFNLKDFENRIRRLRGGIHGDT